MPEQEIMLQAIILLLVLGGILAFAVLGAVFVVRAILRQTSRTTKNSEPAPRLSLHLNLPILGLAIGLLVPTVLKLRLGEWAWIDVGRILVFGLLGAFVGGLLATVARKR